MVAKQQLHEILKLHIIPGVTPIIPLEWHYTNCRIFPIFLNQVILVFMVRLPLVSNSPSEGIRTKTYPVPSKDTNITVRISVTDFVVVGPQKELRIPKLCVGENPIY